MPLPIAYHERKKSPRAILFAKIVGVLARRRPRSAALEIGKQTVVIIRPRLAVHPLKKIAAALIVLVVVEIGRERVATPVVENDNKRCVVLIGPRLGVFERRVSRAASSVHIAVEFSRCPLLPIQNDIRRHAGRTTNQVRYQVHRERPTRHQYAQEGQQQTCDALHPEPVISALHDPPPVSRVWILIPLFCFLQDTAASLRRTRKSHRL